MGFFFVMMVNFLGTSADHRLKEAAPSFWLPNSSWITSWLILVWIWGLSEELFFFHPGYQVFKTQYGWLDSLFRSVNETPFLGGRCDVPCQVLLESVIPSLWSTDLELENIWMSFKTATVWHIPLSSADFKAKSAALLFPWSKSSTRCLLTLEKQHQYRRLERQIYEYGELRGGLLEHPFSFSYSSAWPERSQLRKTQLCQVYQGEIRPCPSCCNLNCLPQFIKPERKTVQAGVMVISCVFSGFLLFECQLCQSGSDTQPAIVCASKDSVLGFFWEHLWSWDP